MIASSNTSQDSKLLHKFRAFWTMQHVLLVGQNKVTLETAKASISIQVMDSVWFQADWIEIKNFGSRTNHIANYLGKSSGNWKVKVLKMAKEFLGLSVFSWSERKIWLLQPQSPKKTLDSHGKFWKMLPAKKKKSKVQQFYPASDCTSLRFLACLSSRVDQRIGDVGVALLCQTARVESVFTFVLVILLMVESCTTRDV